MAGDFHNGLARELLEPMDSPNNYDCVASFLSAAKAAYINTKGSIVWEGDEGMECRWITTPLSIDFSYYK